MNDRIRNFFLDQSIYKKFFLDQSIYNSVVTELVHYVRSLPNQVLIQVGQQKSCSVNIKIDWDCSGM